MQKEYIGENAGQRTVHDKSGREVQHMDQQYIQAEMDYHKKQEARCEPQITAQHKARIFWGAAGV